MTNETNTNTNKNTRTGTDSTAATLTRVRGVKGWWQAVGESSGEWVAACEDTIVEVGP